MKSVKDIKQSIRKLKVESSDQIHSRVLDKLLRALDKSKKQAAVNRPNIWRIIMKSPITKIAAAAVVIVAIGLLIFHTDPEKQNGAVKVSVVARTPGELTNFASLSFAYRQGGMEMVEKVCDKALKQAGQRPANISMQEFSEGINNEKSERTEL